MLVYFSIMILGLAVLCVSLLFGGDGGFEADAPDIGGVEGVDVAGVDTAGGSFDFGSWLSVKVLSAFCVGFGACGMIGRSLGWPMEGQVLFACGAGVAMAAAARAILRAFATSQGSSHVTEASLQGRTGTVTATILEGRVGEVSLGSVHRGARARDGKEIPIGTPVRVVSVGPTLTVERLEN